MQAAAWWGQMGHHLTVYPGISLTLSENKLFCKYFPQFTAASLACVQLGSHREAGCTAYKKGQTWSFSKLKIYFNSLSKQSLPAPSAYGSCFSEVLLMSHLWLGALSQGQLRMWTSRYHHRHHGSIKARAAGRGGADRCSLGSSPEGQRVPQRCARQGTSPDRPAVLPVHPLGRDLLSSRTLLLASTASAVGATWVAGSVSSSLEKYGDL